MKNKPVKQHDLPATYLRRFSIDPNDRELKKMIWCLREAYGKIILEQKSVDSSLFTTTDYYTLENHEAPYSVEYFFRDEIEPRYEKIMQQISFEKDLIHDCRNDLILWLHYNKLRNDSRRSHYKKVFNMSQMLSIVQTDGLKKFNELKPHLDKLNEAQAKYLQLGSFSDKELLDAFEACIGSKHWLLLKSPDSLPFLSSNNPGFSVHIEHDFINFKTLSSSFSTHADATNYFILSPKYCLLISPFYIGTPLDLNVWNQTIEFKSIGQQHLDVINFCTITTASKYLISNSEAMINRAKTFKLQHHGSEKKSE